MPLGPGDGILLKNFTDNTSPNSSMSYRSPGKGLYHIALYLGAYGHEHANAASSMDVDERLNHLGWVYDPKRAKKILDKKETT